MKNIILLICIIFIIKFANSQIFPSPSGTMALGKKKSKNIWQCEAYAWAGPLSYKMNSTARRFTFDLSFWNECWLPFGREDGNFWQNCISQPLCDPGWNKVGEITFIRNNFTEYHKLDVGWRTADMPFLLKISAYFHEVPNEKLYQSDNDLAYYYVSHYLTSIYTDHTYHVDMFMSLGTIALIVNKNAVIIRKPGMKLVTKDSYLSRTFYFGDIDECLSPTLISTQFDNQSHDNNGFEDEINNCTFITCNLSEFDQGDIGTFYAYKEIRGSIPNQMAK
ncbi:MAG: hypothetical protein R2764_23435 [Bacteroidales bacterium]